MYRPNKTPREDDECYALADYCRLRGLMFTHIPNETFTKSWGVRLKNKRLGVAKGVPDYMVLVPRADGRLFLIFIEMKRAKGGRTSREQVAWIDKLDSVSGAVARVCNGFDEAKQFIDDFYKK